METEMKNSIIMCQPVLISLSQFETCYFCSIENFRGLDMFNPLTDSKSLNFDAKYQQL